MKILAIGDHHGNLQKIKKIPIKNIDLILLTGDLGRADFWNRFRPCQTDRVYCIMF